ncbi:MAG: pitrilysin family protein, partial [Gemmatimonadota bacterium]|nr:pitrilysin family protein [Gemmatimonadota bacterium]
VGFLLKENRGDAVTVTFQLRHGNESALMGEATDGSMAGAMLMRGTESRSRQEISDELDRLKARGGIGGGVTLSSGSFTTVRENLPAVLRLAGEILREPAFDAEEFELLREERLAQIEQFRSEPQALAFQAYQRHMNPWPEDHPLYTPTFEEQIARLEAATVEEARAFWETFYEAEGGTMSIVGDFDPEAVRPIIEDIFGSWSAEPAYARIDRPYRDIEPTSVEIETPDKANATMVAAQTIPMTDAHPDYPALLLGNYMLGGGFLNSRLATRIRQEEGLSYGVGSQFGAHPVDEQGNFLAFAIFAPENSDRVLEAFQDVLGEVFETGFTEEEVEAAKRGYLDQRQNGRSNDGSVAQALAANLFWDRTMAFTAEQESAIRELTAETILAAMRRHIDPERMSIFRAGDFANALVS